MIRAKHLTETTTAPFEPKAQRAEPFAFSGLTTTETCDLACVMCHFNGPQAVKKGKTLPPSLVEKVISEAPKDRDLWFGATGEFFSDPHAVGHLEVGARYGHRMAVLTHGQLLTPALLDRILELGVRTVRMSCDSIYADQYAKIRRGGQLQKILDAVSHLNSRRDDYPDLVVEITCTLLNNTQKNQGKFEYYWRGKVDRFYCNAEYYDTFKYRSLMFEPTKRVQCGLTTLVLPNGRIAPCCAVMVHAHDHDVSWLPHAETHTLKEAYDQLCDQYDDPDSELGKICAACEWWVMWAENPNDLGTAYFSYVEYEKPSSEYVLHQPADPATLPA